MDSLGGGDSAEVSIIIVTWNSADTIGSCLASIPSAVRLHTYEVIIIDNASADNTVASAAEVIERLNMPAVIYQEKDNLGFARAVNCGIALSGGQYVFLLNPDCTLADHAIDLMLDLMCANPKIGIVGPLIYSARGTLQRECARRVLPNIWVDLISALEVHKVLPMIKDFWYFTEEEITQAEFVKVSGVSGAAMMIRRALIADVGRLDERMFMYVEDIDYCNRANVSGWDVVVMGRARANHIGGGSEAKANTQWLREVHYAGQKAKVLYYKKENAAAAMVYPFIMVAGHIIKALGFAAIILTTWSKRPLRRELGRYLAPLKWWEVIKFAWQRRCSQ